MLEQATVRVDWHNKADVFDAITRETRVIETVMYSAETSSVGSDVYWGSCVIKMVLEYKCLFQTDFRISGELGNEYLMSGIMKHKIRIAFHLHNFNICTEKKLVY